ncbi:MAG: biotin synthetase, partial [Olpidium bornovanus]
ATVHRANHDPNAVQQCTLLSIKTGGCTEDCAYCPQSSRYDTGVKASKLLEEATVLGAARKARERGSTRFCMGAAWRDVGGKKTNFGNILKYVKEIRAMGMEVCCTLGMLTPEQAAQLKEAGLTAYNHNLDTSREFYPKIIGTRTYDDRLNTIGNVRDAGISVCSGGIVGLGESDEDRVAMLHTLATLPEHPESVPINALLAVPGTPLENQQLGFIAARMGNGAHDRHRADYHAAVDDTSVSGQNPVQYPGADALLHERRKLNFHWRQIADHPQQSHISGRGDV